MKRQCNLIRKCALLCAFALLMSLTLGAYAAGRETGGEIYVVLSDTEIMVNDLPISADESDAVYISHDIIYYEDRDAYDSGNAYGEGTKAERHSESEAAAHTVVNITAPGVYRLSGTLSTGQIFVDLGKNAKSDPEAVVTLTFDNADITCTVAPAVFFYRVYECDQAWVAYDEDETDTVVYTPSAVQDTSEAGAKVVIADGSVNNRITKTNSNAHLRIGLH